MPSHTVYICMPLALPYKTFKLKDILLVYLLNEFPVWHHLSHTNLVFEEINITLNCIFQVCCAYQIFWFFLITFHYWLYRNRNQQLFILQILETSLYFLHSLSLFITDSTFVSVNTLNTPKKMQFFVTLVNAVCSNSCPFFPAGSYRVLVWRETPHSWRMRRLCNLVKLCGF